MSEMQDIKRKMLSGNSSALDKYSQVLNDTFCSEGNPEFSIFTEGQIIRHPLPRNDSPEHNWYRIRHVLKEVYTKYVRRLIQETHDDLLLTRMIDRHGGNKFCALKVYQPERVYIDMSECGIKEDAVHALWLINTPNKTGYFMTDNHGNQADPTDTDSNEEVSNRTLERINSGEREFLDFFQYDPKTGLFLKHEKNTWGNREVARNLAFHGLISYENPISPMLWFSHVLRNLETILVH